MQRHFLLLPLLCALSAWAQADVVRCTDAQGKVSYTDQACPSGSKRTGNVAVPESAGADARNEQPAQDQLDSVNRARRIQRETVEAANEQASQPPAGPAVIDSRGTGQAPGAGTPPSAADSRDSDRGERDGIVAETLYPPPGPGYYRGAAPPRDMRPRLRNCDSTGCNDNLGNHYNRRGQIDRYQSSDGRNCRLVNSTQVCR